MTTANSAITQVEGMVSKVLEKVSGTLSIPEFQQTQAERLSVQQQLDRFFQMTDEDFAQLRSRKGDAEVKRYTQAMLKLAKRGI